MIKEINTQKSKALLSEISNLFDIRKELDQNGKEILFNNEKYQNLLLEKKEIEEKINEIKEKIINSILEEKKTINENIKLIKEDLSMSLNMKKKTVSKLINFYKTRIDKGENELNELTTVWEKIF